MGAHSTTAGTSILLLRSFKPIGGEA